MPETIVNEYLGMTLQIDHLDHANQTYFQDGLKGRVVFVGFATGIKLSAIIRLNLNLLNVEPIFS